MKGLLGFLCVGSVSVLWGALEVATVSVRQRWPWNDLVDVSFTLSGTAVDTPYRVELAADAPGRGRVTAHHLMTEPVVKGNGPHRLVWDMGKDLPGYAATNLRVRVSVTEFLSTTPVFLCLDLAAPLAPGSLTQTYPVRYTTQEPDWTDDTNKTRAYWMRRLRAGTFTMGTGETFFSRNPIATSLPSHNVTLTNDFYIAVFETTQQQWHHVMGTWPSFFTNAADRASRPVEKVKMSQIRGGTEGIKWPEGTRVDAGSFVALVRERSGLAAFDLPTEAQWEFACRAGTTDKYYSADWDEKTFARYANNGGKVLNAQGVLVDPLGDVAADDGGTARVGSYAPNPWGLYDMAGNVFELLLDRHSFDVSPSAYQVAEVEPVGLTAAQQPDQNERVGRGGGCTHGIDSCSSYFRRPVSSAISVCGCRFVVPVQK